MRPDPNHVKNFITVTEGMRGFFAVHVWWNPDGFWEPYESDVVSFDNKDSAIAHARVWAEIEELPFYA